MLVVAGGLDFGLSLHLHPYFVHVSSPRFWQDCMYMPDNGISTKILCAGHLFEVVMGMISPNIYIYIFYLKDSN